MHCCKTHGGGYGEIGKRTTLRMWRSLTLGVQIPLAVYIWCIDAFLEPVHCQAVFGSLHWTFTCLFVFLRCLAMLRYALLPEGGPTTSVFCNYVSCVLRGRGSTIRCFQKHPSVEFNKLLVFKDKQRPPRKNIGIPLPPALYFCIVGRNHRMHEGIEWNEIHSVAKTQSDS